MTLLLSALLVAVVLSVTGVPGGAQLHLILPLLFLARFGISKGHDRSVRQSMDCYLETVVADLDKLSLSPASATYAIRADAESPGSPTHIDRNGSGATSRTSAPLVCRSANRYSA